MNRDQTNCYRIFSANKVALFSAAALLSLLFTAALSFYYAAELAALHSFAPALPVTAVFILYILINFFYYRKHRCTDYIAAEIADSRRKDHLLIEQSRMAAMGELLIALSHTWRQPLNTLALILANIKDLYEYGELDETRMRRLSSDADQVLQKLSATIDDFRAFHSLKQEVTDFIIHDVLIESITVTQSVFSVHGIAVHVEVLEGLSVRGIPGRFAQVILNILFNARDSLTESRVSDPEIRIRLYKENRNAVLAITDNGPGVPENILSKIFDPYFTTKKNAPGIGLYMAQMTVKEMNGRIEASNSPDGFTVTVSLPLSG